eukprot:m.91864 g.91864  ORF g.91864 m.91864 type:complete len:229 (+) comp9930_c0_seq1:196-882(+)
MITSSTALGSHTTGLDGLDLDDLGLPQDVEELLEWYNASPWVKDHSALSQLYDTSSVQPLESNSDVITSTPFAPLQSLQTGTSHPPSQISKRLDSESPPAGKTRPSPRKKKQGKAKRHINPNAPEPTAEEEEQMEGLQDIFSDEEMRQPQAQWEEIIASRYAPTTPDPRTWELLMILRKRIQNRGYQAKHKDKQRLREEEKDAQILQLQNENAILKAQVTQLQLNQRE